MWFGLARQRSVVLPSWKGWLVLFALLAFVAVLVFREAYPYLAAECRLPKADVVLVEGWVADTVMEQAKREIDEGRCDWICTAGVDLDRGSYLSEYKDWATLAAENLKAMGVPEEKIFVAPGGPSQRHRTYLGHEKAKEKLAMLERSPLRINIITEGPHGLRSLLVARKVFGDSAILGVISMAPEAYDPKRWWTTSSGLKAVFMELIGSTFERVADSGR